MATLEPGADEGPGDIAGEGTGSEPPLPFVPADLLAFERIADFFATTDPHAPVPEQPLTAAALIALEADANSALAPAEPGSAFTETDGHARAAAHQIQAAAPSGSGFAFLHS